MTWPNELELDLTAIAQGGDAVGHDPEGRAVFANGGLPGERVRVRLHSRQKRWAKGTVTAVLRAAPERISSPCPLESVCGAADWRWVDHAAQVRWKQQVLREQLQHLGGLAVDDLVIGTITPPDAAQAWNYRTTVELHAAPDTLGYYAPHSRRSHDVPTCCLHHPLINDALLALRRLLPHDPPFSSLTLRCAPSTEQVLAIFGGEAWENTEEEDEEWSSPSSDSSVGWENRAPTGGDERPRPDDLVALARQWQRTFPALVGVVSEVGRTPTTLVGRPWLVHEVAGLQFQVSAEAFFQINAHATELLVDRVTALVALKPHERLLDVFCGVGTFTLPLARRATAVVGIESWPAAIADARQSAKANGITNAEWHIGTAETVLPQLAGPWDAVLLDPPRRGCEPPLLDALLALRPARIVYVSCHPGTLARDCKHLATGGYRVAHAEVIDLFPQTHHVESIVRLELA